jgi:hypothetical protein
MTNTEVVLTRRVFWRLPLANERERIRFFGMKTNWRLLPVVLSAVLMLLSAGCATPMKSFNQDYSENFPPQPNYAIDNMDNTHFKIRLNQGTPMPEQHGV